MDPTLLERGLTRRVIELLVEEYLHSHGSGLRALSSWTSNCCLVEKILTGTISRLGDISKGKDTVYLIFCTVLCESDTFSSIVDRLTNRE
jgi:hypothetical protein